MKIALAQINPTIGDFQGNLEKIKSAAQSARKKKADLVLFPEQVIGGYPARDLTGCEFFIRKNQEALASLLPLSKKICMVIGLVLPNDEKAGHKARNAIAILKNGELFTTYNKRLLPTYDVFDEARHFYPGKKPLVFDWGGIRIGVAICEDMWNPKEFWKRPRYETNPIEELAALAPDIILNASASPFSLGHDEIRQQLIQAHAKKYGIPIALCNQVGANDDLIFDGQSFVVNGNGDLIAKGAAFEEDLIVIDPLSSDHSELPAIEENKNSSIQVLRKALVLGVRDYARKCSFSKAVVGLSGGIDSSIVACLAVEALGADSVLGVMMPSRFSSLGSLEDSKNLASLLKIETLEIGIEPIYQSYLFEFDSAFGKADFGKTEENIQARIRGNLLMALSNRKGSLVLSTGNKTEISVGYCTLYGDLGGGLAVISDVPKTLVYELAHFYQDEMNWIPNEIIQKPPSAELKPNQLDQDTLPPYDILDQILSLYIERGTEKKDIIKQGFEEKTVNWIIEAVEKAEYKRRQAPIGLRVTSKAFGSGRRIPIAWKFKGV